MPHKCTNCERTFPDGSKEMLSGCPDCGGNKFQFQPGSADADDDEPGDGSKSARADRSEQPTRPDHPDRTSQGEQPNRTSRDEHPDQTDRTGGTSQSDFGFEEPQEDRAQASARSDVVDPNALTASTDIDSSDTELGASEGPRDSNAPDTSEAFDTSSADLPGDSSAGARPPTVDEGRVVDAPDSEAPGNPDIADLREELNDQFESIRIVDRGEYELNLMELYDRQEYIISLQEDGRYVIEVPDTWSDPASSE